MKLLVFAHIPPPHHGQSYMVKLMLDGLGGDARERTKSKIKNPQSAIECYHVNAQFSQDMEDIGVFRSGKIFLILRYCAEAVWCRFRHGVTNFYYVPAPGKKTTMFRDWIVMALCRPFFKRTIFHWHALGLGEWLHDERMFYDRWITHWLMDRPDLSIALAIPSMRPALWFKSRRVEIVANGIPDPCPGFDGTVLPLRRARAEARRKLLAGERLSDGEKQSAGGDPQIFKVLYLAHCTRDKGLFDTLDAVALANAQLVARNSPIHVHITVAGAFISATEEEEFKRRIGQPDLAAPLGMPAPETASGEAADNQQSKLKNQKSVVTYAGFVSGGEKNGLFRECDCYFFPTYYSAEAQPVSIIEAMAFGLPIITTRWRAIPDVLPPDYPLLLDIHDIDHAAELLQRLIKQGNAVEELRTHFLKSYSDKEHIRRLRDALAEVETDAN